MRKLAKYALAMGIGIAISIAVALRRDAFSQSDPALLAQYLCDAFFVAAVALGGAGLLAFVASDGFFDMIGFGVKKLLSLFQRDDRKLGGTFYDYRAWKMARRNGGYGFLLVTGALFLALASLFLVLSYGGGAVLTRT